MPRPAGEFPVMNTVACVYFENGQNNAVHPFSRNYTIEYVERLYHWVKENSNCEFVCITDVELPRKIWHIPFLQPERNYWSCLEVFGRNFGNVLSIGLDTIFNGPIDDLFRYEGQLGMLHDPNNENVSINGVLRFPYRPDIWNKYVRNKDQIQSRYKNEMAYIASFEHDFLDDIYPGQILSYKKHVLTGHDTSDARIVYFHGKPKPKDVGWKPIPTN